MEGSSRTVIEMQGICKAFPGVIALDQVDFELWSGEVHVLLGENGAGKSTLMKILSGALRRDAGRIRVLGRSVELGSPREAQQQGISTIYQEFNLIPQLSAVENIFLGREPTRRWGIIDRRRLAEWAEGVLRELGVTFDPRMPVRRLSVAEQQMVEVAKALALNARVLVMDEPTSALTEAEIRTLFATIRRLKERGVGVVYISHRLEEIFELGDRVTVLRDGRKVATQTLTEVSIGELVYLMANREVGDHFPRVRPDPGEELLRVEGLSGGHAFHDVSFSLRRGEIVGLAGLMGAGRTALGRAIFGADPVEAGKIFFRGRPVEVRSPAAAIRLGIGLLTEDRKRQGLVLNLSVCRNIGLTVAEQLSRLGVMRNRSEEDLASRFAEELRIKTPSIRQKAVNLSGGNQQKVVLSKWLARQCDVLIFDEPTRGIDVGSKVEIYQWMNRLTAEGAAILMISSELPEILGMSDRVLVMHEGAIRAEFAAEALTQAAVLRAALGQ